MRPTTSTPSASVGDMERNFSTLQKEFWDFIPPRWREAHIDVVAFATQEAFDDYAGREGGLPHGEKGYSSAREPRIVFLRQDVYYRDVMIVVHEMTHVFNRFCVASCPLWLDEGMAQYYANYAGESAGNTALASGVNVEALVILDGASRRGVLLPFAVLMKMPESVFYGEDSRLNYAEAWALVYWMRRGLPDGDAHVHVLLHRSGARPRRARCLQRELRLQPPTGQYIIDGLPAEALQRARRRAAAAGGAEK